MVAHCTGKTAHPRTDRTGALSSLFYNLQHVALQFLLFTVWYTTVTIVEWVSQVLG